RTGFAARESPAGRARFFQNREGPEWCQETIVANRAQSTSEPARAAGILPEAGAIDHDRQARFDDLDGNILYGAHRHVLRRIDAVAVDARAPADTRIGLMPDLA